MGFRVPEEEIKEKIKRIQKKLQENDMDALFVVQRVDLFYFTGTAQNGYLYIPAEGEPLLMIKKYYPRAREESPIKDIIEITSIRNAFKYIYGYYGRMPKRIGMEFDVMPVREFFFYDQQVFYEQECADASHLIHEVRMIKSEWEIEQMEKAAELSHLTFQYIRENLRPGYTEMEFAGMVETFARRHGHGGQLRIRDYKAEGYPWHILSGKSGGKVGLLDAPTSGEGTSPAFPCGAGHKIIERDEPIMIDFGTMLNGFHCDETRMFAIGSMPKKALDAYKATLDIQHYVLENVKPGITMDELFQLSLKKAHELKCMNEFLGPPGCKVSFIGHGIGLELVEQPIIAMGQDVELKPGMIFALEPKMVFKDEFAAGIESVFLVTENGYRLISKTPAEVFVV